ncbi:hypothetical protein, partial [Burkholderia multivorans]|uniref:hypothetical protein n=1 Tax=Burkholderia multivorans TaxID=87883 RepID=UPI00137926B3
ERACGCDAARGGAGRRIDACRVCNGARATAARAGRAGRIGTRHALKRREIGNFDRLKIVVKWPMTFFNNYFSAPADNRKRLISIGF